MTQDSAVVSPDVALFFRRPPRMDVCATCRGTGHVDRPYALSPLPAGAVRPAGAPEDAIAALVGSSSIFEAAHEAGEIADVSGRPVAFLFIGDLVVVRPHDDPKEVARAWWTAAWTASRSSRGRPAQR